MQKSMEDLAPVVQRVDNATHQSHSKSPRYPYSAAGMGFMDLWDTVICLTCVVTPEVQESWFPFVETWSRTHVQ